MVDLTFDDRGVSISLANAPAVNGAQLARWMADVVAYLHGRVQANIGSGGLIGRRTGNLARAIQHTVVVDPDGHTVTGDVWPDPTQAIYGAIQEEGGTVFPKNRQFLAIPLEAMQTGNGVARARPGDVKANPQAFGFAGTFVAKGVIFGRTEGGRDASIIPLFALKSSVMIPATHYLATTLTQETAWIADRLEALTGEMVRVSFGGDEAFA